MTATSIVIFGASGDLTHRKLIPALYHQFKSKRLPDDLNIIGVSRTKYEHHEFRDSMKEAVKEIQEAALSLLEQTDLRFRQLPVLDAFGLFDASFDVSSEDQSAIDKKIAIDRLELALKHAKDDHHDDLDLLAHLWPTPDDVGGLKVCLLVRFALLLPYFHLMVSFLIFYNRFLNRIFIIFLIKIVSSC